MSFWQISGSAAFEDLETIYGFKVTQQPGMGMAPVNNISSTYGLLDGALFQRTHTEAKQFTLIGTLRGTSVANLHTRRKSLISVIAPDRSGSPGEPVILRYTGGASTLQASCFYRSGLEMGNVRARTEANIAFSLDQFDPYWEKITNSSATLTVQTTVASANYILQRSACGVWGAMGSGGSAAGVLALIYDNNSQLYAAGDFTNMGGVASTARIAKWTGTSWSAMSSGIDSTVSTLAIGSDGTTLYVGGNFIVAGGVSASRVVKWTGTSFSSIGAANLNVAKLLFAPDGNLYAGGNFSTIGGVSCLRIARWNGVAWTSLSSGMNNSVTGLAFGLDNNLYAGGTFSTAGGTIACGVAKWSASTWSPLGAGISGTVQSIEFTQDGTLYAGGDFSIAGGVAASSVARWNGSGWGALGNNGVNNTVYTLTAGSHNTLYIGGFFTSAAGQPLLDRAIQWNGTVFIQSIDVDLPGAATIRTIAESTDGKLTIGYDTSGTASAAGVTAITNSGTAATFPILTACAPTSSSARLYQLVNYTTGDAIYFNLTLNPSEVATLDLRPGQKTLTSNIRGNIISAVLPGSNISTWRLLPGVNNISTFLTGGSGAAKLSWVERFWSIDN